jgi:hypothetical protein
MATILAKLLVAGALLRPNFQRERIFDTQYASEPSKRFILCSSSNIIQP